MKAAGAAIGFERSTRPSVTVSAGASLCDMLEERKRLEQAKQVIDVTPKPGPAA